MSNLPEAPIPPGGSAEVIVSSKIDQKNGPFKHSASVQTNDPSQPSLTFTISGTIRTILGTYPAKAVFSGSRGKTTPPTEVTLYSQVWDEFTVAQVTPSREGLTWEIRAAEEQTLQELDARSGYCLTITVPPDLPCGNFWEHLEIAATPSCQTQSERSVKLDVTGNVPGRITVYGRRLAAGKIVRLGTVARGRGAREQLTMRVRDDHRTLSVEGIETTPEFLEVRVGQYNEVAANAGLYTIDVEVPPDAPPSSYMGVRRGQLRIRTDHPHVPVIELDVEFAVTSS
jgi:hypothetical protein